MEHILGLYVCINIPWQMLNSFSDDTGEPIKKILELKPPQKVARLGFDTEHMICKIEWKNVSYQFVLLSWFEALNLVSVVWSDGKKVNLHGPASNQTH